MARLLDEIEWGESIVAPVPVPEWADELKRRGGHMMEVDRRIGTSRWLRETAFAVTQFQPSAVGERLHRIGTMVTAQENACRYCYGATRAYMKMLGYTESFIQAVERDVHLAQIDERERAFIVFCRSLARSRPRPSRAACEALLRLGYSAAEVAEMAFMIAAGCFYNRVSTFIACPPERQYERLANSPLGRLIGWTVRLSRTLGLGKAATGPAEAAPEAAELAEGRFGRILMPLAGLPAARLMHTALESAFESEVLDRTTKALMFAVVARTLNCANCVGEATTLLAAYGIGQAETEAALATLSSPRLPPASAALLSWTRDTVHYDAPVIQQKTRELAAGLGRDELLEAIGVASLANATVRLAMLLE